MESNKQKIFIAIHRAIHNPEANGVRIKQEPYHVQVGKNHCRYITYDKKVFIQHDSRRPGALSRLAQQNQQYKITRIIRSGAKWGYIVEDHTGVDIVDPLDGA